MKNVDDYDKMVDEKLCELYEVLTKLNSLKEKTEATKQVVEGLASAGVGRISELNKIIDKARQAIASSWSSNIDEIKEEVNKISKSILDLTKVIGEEASRISGTVAELKDVDILKSLNDIQKSSNDCVQELQQSKVSIEAKVCEEIAKILIIENEQNIKISESSSRILARLDDVINKSNESLKSSIEENKEHLSSEGATLKNKISESSNDVLIRIDELKKLNIECVEKHATEILNLQKEDLKVLQNTINACTLSLKDDFKLNIKQQEDLKNIINTSTLSLKEVFKENSEQLTNLQNSFSKDLHGLGVQLKQNADFLKKMQISMIENNKKVISTIRIWAIVGIILLLTAFAPIIVSAWKCLFV